MVGCREISNYSYWTIITKRTLSIIVCCVFFVVLFTEPGEVGEVVYISSWNYTFFSHYYYLCAFNFILALYCFCFCALTAIFNKEPFCFHIGHNIQFIFYTIRNDYGSYLSVNAHSKWIDNVQVEPIGVNVYFSAK